MIRVIEICFAEGLKDHAVLAKMKKMIPSYGYSLIDDAELCRQVRDDTANILNIGKTPTVK